MVAHTANHVPLTQKGDLAIYYELPESESTEKRGIVEIDIPTGRSRSNLFLIIYSLVTILQAQISAFIMRSLIIIIDLLYYTTLQNHQVF